MAPLSIFTDLRIQDIVDVLFLSIIAYHLYVWFKGTKAFKALLGLAILGAIFTMAKYLGLFLTTWFFQILWQVLVIFLIILFQKEIRQIIELVNPFKQISRKKILLSDKWISSFADAIVRLSREKIGAIIVIERADNTDEFVIKGIRFEADPTYQVLISIFQKSSPLHDGAILIKSGRIQMASCYLPLSSSENLPPEWGTRHRAGLGLTEKCDAWVFVISEETGTIHLMRDKGAITVDTVDQLKAYLKDAMKFGIKEKRGWSEQISSLVVNRWKEKLATFFIVSAVWFMFAGQQDFERNIRVPVELKNIPPKIEVVEPINPVVTIRIRGRRKDVSLISSDNVLCWIDLSMSRYGKREFKVLRSQVSLPNEKINVLDIKPPMFLFKFKKLGSSPD